MCTLRRSRKRASFVAFLSVVLLLVAGGAAGAGTTTFTNPAPVSITGLAGLSNGSPYPSTITVSGVAGTATKVTVTLSLLDKPGVAVKDLDFLLVSPAGKTLILLSDAVGEATSAPVTLTFDDAAAGPVPLTASPIVSGTYQPTNYAANAGGFTPCSSATYNEPDPDVFTAPAPAGPYGSTLSVFNGDDPNGVWSLYAVLDCLGSGPGTLQGGWSITIDTPTAARVTSFSASPGKRGVTVRWRTAAEVDALGFNVYRATGSGPLRKLNRTLIGARGGTTGASYRFVDRSTRAAGVVVYRLQLVDRNGTRSWSGAARVRTKAR
jgi:hypothetical protein